MEESKNENLNQNELSESNEEKKENVQEQSAEVQEEASALAEKAVTEGPSAEKEEEAALTQEDIPSETEELHDDVLESDDTVVVETDEHHEEDEHAHKELEIPDYASMDNRTLIEEAEKLINENVAEIKEHIEALKTVLLKSLDDERHEKLEEFVEAGNARMDFQFQQPIREQFKKIYGAYRNKRDQYYKELNERLSLNLEVKLQIIEDIKNLPNREDIRVPEKYKIFRDLQERWKNTGPVVKAESKVLYNNYHFHINNFYDFLRISNELRELDFKKNLESKTKLCEEAEALSEEDTAKGIFLKLQELHKSWREIGPVDKEHSEPLWQRFSEATKKIHEKRHDYFEQMKADQEVRLVEKEKVFEELQERIEKPINSHGAWQKAIKEVEEIRKKFKSFGPIHHPKNDEIWEKFREANRTFNQAKNKFYKELKKQQHRNLEMKKELLAKAQELKDSDTWKETANELKKIQQSWKKIGYVPKAESDKIWGEFRDACNHFFNRLTEHNSKQDEKYLDNLEEKKKLLEEVKAFKPADDSKAAVETLQSFIGRWRSIGRVPRNEKNIEGDFNNVIDKHFDSLKLERNQGVLMRFENKIMSFLDNNEKFKFEKEIDMVRKKIDEVKKEMNQLENNLGFFAHVDESNPMVKDVKKKINRSAEQIELLKQKLKAGRDAFKNYQKPEEKPAETKPEDSGESEEQKTEN